MKKRNPFSVGSFFGRILKSFCSYFYQPFNISKLDDVKYLHKSRKVAYNKRATNIPKKRPIHINQRRQAEYFGSSIGSRLKVKTFKNGRR